MAKHIGHLCIIRLDGEDLSALRRACFVRDKFRCQECGRMVSPLAPEWADSRAHMAHIVGRGRGGSDTIDNVTTKCRSCHMVNEHNPRCIRAKA